jgi:predicted nucleic acid-binding Zn ribbon protein
MRRVNRLERIDQVIKRVLKGCGIEEEVTEERCLKLWSEIMGKRIADKNKPLYVKDKIIFIRSESPVWAKELSFEKKEIIKKINERLSKRFIKDVIFI